MASNKYAKKDWVVCDQQCNTLADRDGIVRIFKTEKDAMKAASEYVQSTDDIEAYVYQMTHIVLRQQKPVIEKL